MDIAALSRRHFLQLAGASGLTLVIAPAAASADDQAGGQLAKLVNDYRKSQALPPIPVSPKLTKVALTHVEDLNKHRKNENMHSWSNNGTWKGGVYDPADKKTHPLMWNKPKEIAQYDSNGFEVVAGGAGSKITPAQALDSWKKSAAHNTVLLNQGIWKQFPWKAVGAACAGDYACVWFGMLEDK